VASAPLVGEKEEYVPDEEATVADDETKYFKLVT
jgi:hypothetical protein